MTDTMMLRVEPLTIRWVAVFLAGSASALIGGYWDDAWHTERGRDSFFIAPHVAIYAGVGLAGLALSAWLLVSARQHGVRATLRHPPALLALVSVGATLASAPIDNAWHEAFGRDSVIWSPPHALGIVGTGALAVAVLVELALTPRSWAARMQPVAGGLVLAAFAFLVVEYDTDVPQFDVVWYLPVLAGGAALALAIVRRLSTSRWAATRAALVHLVFVGAVAAFLTAAGFAAPALPLVAIAAAALELTSRRTGSALVQGGVFAVVLYAAYVPTLSALGDGVELDAADVAIGLPIAWLAAALGLAVLSDGPAVVRRRAVVAAVVLAAGMLVPAASAHDPGQGEPAGTVSLEARAADGRITLTAAVPAPCGRWQAARLVARRAGVQRVAPMRRDGCRFTGSTPVAQRGRWFVYAELTRTGRAVEAWLPVVVGDRPAEVRDDSRYAYVPRQGATSAVKVVAGIGLYGAMAGLLGALVALVRRSAPAREVTT